MGPLRLAPLLGALSLAAGLAQAAPAAAAPTPFGHPCVPQDGVRFCATTDLQSRVPSFDGTPIDVDVTLPPTGDGPFPTVVLHHGLGQTKSAFEGTGGDPAYNDVALARRGFAVVTPTARGFGSSCGKPESRTAGCENGFVRLMDMRYEVRDVQTLLGQLVDEGVTQPTAIGATGVSYGGGLTMMLAFLKDRVRLPDGSFAPWRSPKGTPISLAAAWPRWGWTNGAAIFTRNGRDPFSERPFGAPAKAYADLIFGVGKTGYVAPTGGDLTADILLWQRVLDAGKETAQAKAVLDNAYRYHGVTTLGLKPSPLLVQQGWTDALFPVPQAVGAYERLRKADPAFPVTLQLGDFGHAPGANHPKDVAAVVAQGVGFLEARLMGKGTPPAPGGVTTWTMTCPKEGAAGGGPFTAPSFGALAPKRLVTAAKGSTFRVSSKGGSKALAASLAPASSTGSDLCTTYRPDRTSKATLAFVSPGTTMVGQPVLTGRAAAKGAYATLIARLWDRNPATGKQRLITRGAYRLDPGTKRFRFALDGNAWRFAKGHRVVLELLGRDAPTYLPAPNAFSVTLSGLELTVPVR